MIASRALERPAVFVATGSGADALVGEESSSLSSCEMSMTFFLGTGGAGTGAGAKEGAKEGMKEGVKEGREVVAKEGARVGAAKEGAGAGAAGAAGAAVVGAAAVVATTPLVEATASSTLRFLDCLAGLAAPTVPDLRLLFLSAGLLIGIEKKACSCLQRLRKVSGAQDILTSSGLYGVSNL